MPGGETIGLDSFDWIDDEIRAGVRAQGQGLAVVAAMVAIAAVAVTGQLVSRQVRLAADQRRAMSAMGLTRAQVLADPLGATAMPIAVGALGAAGLAAALSGVFPTGFVRRIEPDPGPMLDPLAHGLGAVLFAALLVIWVLLALLLGGRETRAPHRLGMVDRLTGRLPPGPAVTGVRFALTRHPRDAGSVRAPLLGLVLVLSVLIGALTFGISVERFLDEPARHGSNFDFATGAGEQEVPEEIRALLEEDPDVEDLTLYGTQFGNVGSRRIYVTGMQQVRGDLEPDILSGRLARQPDEIVLGRVDARKLSVEVGDELVVGGADDTATFQITGLAVIPSIEGGDGVGKGAIVTLEGLRRLDADATLGAAAVRLRPGATDAADRLGEAMGFPVGRPDPPATVQNMERARGTPFIVAGSLAALALLSMSHQLITSARRRRRDLAVLRAIGADRRWVTSVLHWQVTALAAVVVALATPLGIAAGRLVYQAYIDRIGARTDVSVPFALLAAIALGLLVLGNVGAMWPARRVRHERPARVLSDE